TCGLSSINQKRNSIVNKKERRQEDVSHNLDVDSWADSRRACSSDRTWQGPDGHMDDHTAWGGWIIRGWIRKPADMAGRRGQRYPSRRDNHVGGRSDLVACTVASGSSESSIERRLGRPAASEIQGASGSG